MYGYIYKTTNLINNKIYIGKKKGEFTDKYLGSGKYLKNAINKYGFENFKVEIVDYCNTLQEQNEKEKYWINYYRNQIIGMYNISNGGDGGDIFSCLPKKQLQKIKNYISYCNKNGICGNKGRYLSEEHKRKISASHKGKSQTPEHIENHRQAILGKQAWNKGLTKDDLRVAKYCRKPGEFHHTQKTKEKLSLKFKESNRDMHKSLETRQKLSEALKGKPKSKEHKEKIGKIAKGRIWINNGEKSKMIYPHELENYLEQGYKQGRKLNE